MAKAPHNVIKMLTWNSVDLLKAGTGEYNGEAAATIKNLVTDQINTIELVWGADPEAFLEEARSILYLLGGFVIHDERRESYFQKQVDTLIDRVKRQPVRSPASQLP